MRTDTPLVLKWDHSRSKSGGTAYAGNGSYYEVVEVGIAWPIPFFQAPEFAGKWLAVRDLFTSPVVLLRSGAFDWGTRSQPEDYFASADEAIAAIEAFHQKRVAALMEA